VAARASHDARVGVVDDEAEPHHERCDDDGSGIGYT
jgi:hypothetical protein